HIAPYLRPETGGSARALRPAPFRAIRVCRSRVCPTWTSALRRLCPRRNPAARRDRCHLGVAINETITGYFGRFGSRVRLPQPSPAQLKFLRFPTGSPHCSEVVASLKRCACNLILALIS